MTQTKKLLTGLLAIIPLFLGRAGLPVEGGMSFKDLSGTRHQIASESETKAWVFLFVWHTCPVANAYAPEIERIYQSYKTRDIQFFLVHVSPDVTEETLRKHSEDYRLTLPVIRDSEHRLVDYCGARMTPEAVVVASNLEIVYRGRIDDRQTAYGKRRHEAGQKDLRDTLDTILSGTIPDYRKTPVIGCYIPEAE